MLKLRAEKPIDGDGRTPSEIIEQVKSLTDDILQLWYDDIPQGQLGKLMCSATRKFQDIEIEKEFNKRYYDES